MISSPIVTPCMGVWIETACLYILFFTMKVTPCMGVWIETDGCAEYQHR